MALKAYLPTAVFIASTLSLTAAAANLGGPALTIADFSTSAGVSAVRAGTAGEVNNWVEISDTYRPVGQSKAELVVHATQTSRSAIFFSMLNPNANKAGFAGVSVYTEPFDLSAFSHLAIVGRVRGNVNTIKVTLRDAELDSERSYGNYKAFLKVDLDSDFAEMRIPLSDFVYAFRGVDDPTYRKIDLTQITQLGIQSFAGFYEDGIKQSGATAFEIKSIVARNLNKGR